MKLMKRTGPGRPTTITNRAIRLLEIAFGNGCNVREALAFAAISKDSYSRFLQRQPEFRERFQQLREYPVLLAKRNVAQALHDGDLSVSRWFLEKRSPEFSNKASFDTKVKKRELSEGDVMKKLSEFLGQGVQDPVT